jgi:YVTN family beta-propeller protein
MKYFLLPSVIVLFLLLVSCNQEEKLIDSTNDEWQLLVANNDGSPVLSHYKMPALTLVSNDVYFDNNGEKLVGDVTKIAEFMDVIYLFIPSKYRIETISAKTFKKLATIDFSAKSLVPSDICFPNATDAYICHGNDTLLTIWDMYFLKKKDTTISVGKHPVSIACSGNQIYTANQGDNTVSVIDSRSHMQEAVIPVAPYPTYIKSKNNGTEFIVLSLGSGKIDLSENKTAAIASFIDINTRKVTATQEIGYGAYKSVNQIPQGFAVTNTDWGFIPTNEALLRLDTRSRNRVILVTKISATWIAFNNKFDEIIYLKKEGANCQIITADVVSGAAIGTFNLPLNITALHPM